MRVLGVLIGLIWSSALLAEVIEVTVYADRSYPPYSYEDQGQPSGVYTEILRQAFDRMEGYRVTIVPVPWKRGLSYIESGQGFAIYPPYYRPDQRPYIRPYSMPIIDERVVVFCHEDVMQGAGRPHWPEDYYGLSVGNNAGFELGGIRFWQAVKEGKIKLDESGGTRSNLLKLGMKRVDCYINDRLSILFELGQLKRIGKYQEGAGHARLIEGATISLEQGFIGFTDRDQGRFGYKDDFIKRFNTILYEMRRSGELGRIVDRFLGGNVINDSDRS